MFPSLNIGHNKSLFKANTGRFMSILTHDFEQQVSQALADARRQLLAKLQQASQVHERRLHAKLTNEPESDWVALLSEHLGPEYKDLIIRLERLEATQCQFDLGLFGFCSDCEEPIEPHRLEKDVTTQRCARCDSISRAQSNGHK